MLSAWRGFSVSSVSEQPIGAKARPARVILRGFFSALGLVVPAVPSFHVERKSETFFTDRRIRFQKEGRLILRWITPFVDKEDTK
jgi:hypothetical protein